MQYKTARIFTYQKYANSLTNIERQDERKREDKKRERKIEKYRDREKERVYLN